MCRNRRIACGVLGALVLAVFLAGCCCNKEPYGPYGPKPGTDIKAGVDVFQTSTSQATTMSFAAHPIPANFFCPGSPPFAGKIEFRGEPLVTDPPGVTANGDTIVQRLADGASGTPIPIKVRALRLTSVNNMKIACPGGDTDWRVDVCACGNQPTTKIVAKVDQACGCGHFDGRLRIKVCLRFTQVPGGKVAGPVSSEVDLKIADMPWCPNPGKGEPIITQPFRVDTSCGGQPDLDKLPGTSNFFPGWTCDLQQPGEDCLTKYAALTHCHSAGDPNDPDHKHCVNPMCPRQD